jgi:hypothetical protein
LIFDFEHCRRLRREAGGADLRSVGIAERAADQQAGNAVAEVAIAIGIERNSAESPTAAYSRFYALYP